MTHDQLSVEEKEEGKDKEEIVEDEIEITENDDASSFYDGNNNHHPTTTNNNNNYTSHEETTLKNLDDLDLRNVKQFLEETFHRAILTGNSKVVYSLLVKFPALARYKDEFGRNVLNIAAITGSVEMVKILLDAGIRVDSVDSVQRKTSLHMCSEVGVMRLLCERGANPNKIDISGKVPLYHLIEMAHSAFLSTTIEVLYNSPRYKTYVEMISILIHAGADPWIACDNKLQSCIHLAAERGDYNILYMLLSISGMTTTLDQPDIAGNTALLLSAGCEQDSGEQLKITMLLLNLGASVNVANDCEESILHLICANRSLCLSGLAEPMLEMLIDLNGEGVGLDLDVNCRDIDGCTPLIVACASREWDLCRLLLRGGADLNIPCSMNSSFLQSGESSIHSTDRHRGESSGNRTRTNSEDGGIVSQEDISDISCPNLISPRTQKIIEESDCTSSDLMPKKPRKALFSCISSPQTMIPSENRDRCMNCASTFGGYDDTTNIYNYTLEESFASSIANSLISYMMWTSGKHHCRLCGRVVCASCSPYSVHRSQMPPFVQSSCTETSMRVCLVCFDVIPFSASQIN